MRKGKCGAWAFCQNETSFERKEWGFAQKLGGFYGQRRREGRDGTEGEIKGADWERAGRTYTKKLPCCQADSGGVSFVAHTARSVVRSEFSTWRRRGATA